MEYLWIALSIICLGLLLWLIIYLVLRAKKTKYPELVIEVDISNKKISNSSDALDYYIFNFGTYKLLDHIDFITKWKGELIAKCKGNQKKIDKLNKKFNAGCFNAFKFIFYRTKTFYRQINYQRYPEKRKIVAFQFCRSDQSILHRINFLKENDCYVTLTNFSRLDQRKALTKELREHIKKRDNYTCQICGKYMPDEVGLHIDHIIPVSKGGKSIPSNLRVLCSKCNGRKGNK